jgi:beta-N-acetylhexosaminidase
MKALHLKRRLCSSFDLSSCTGTPADLEQVGGARPTVAQIAVEAVTPLYPSADELAVRLPRPPRPDEDILILTDAREAQDCAACPPFYLLDPQALRDTILRLYGPGATGQVDPDRVQAFTFAQLSGFLQSGSPDLERFLRDAEWIVFAQLDYAPAEEPSSAALKLFLREWTASLETQKVIVMAYEAPYYLDTTEVSKLTAYYGIYSKTEPFIVASARALFLEFPLTGRLPVSVEGVGYDLSKQLSPDPDQVISVLWADQPALVAGTPPPVELDVGDALRVRTSVIVDNNGSPVPDGTPVTFRYRYPEIGLGGVVDATTVGGVAEATVTLEYGGFLEIYAISEPARNSLPLQVVKLGDRTQILTPTPTATPTFTPTPTPSSTPTPVPTATPTPTLTPTPEPALPPPEPPEPRVRWIDLVLAVLGMIGAGGLVLGAVEWSGLDARLDRPKDVALRLALWSVVCGLAGYLLYGLGLPGTGFLEGVAPGIRGLLIGFGFGLLPLAAVVWLSNRAAQGE